MPFASIYPRDTEKVDRKGHTEEELDQGLTWRTGYDKAGRQTAIAVEGSMETGLAKGPWRKPKGGRVGP